MKLTRKEAILLNKKEVIDRMISNNSDVLYIDNNEYSFEEVSSNWEGILEELLDDMTQIIHTIATDMYLFLGAIRKANGIVIGDKIHVPRYLYEKIVPHMVYEIPFDLIKSTIQDRFKIFIKMIEEEHTIINIQGYENGLQIHTPKGIVEYKFYDIIKKFYVR